ncbi:ThiF family adenylyltransferase [Sphingobium indicum]|uniref:HesA/MoeB/ThiF family protein n=1 Tax=Sphingobium indicum TaxID=332055 RepID=UPI0035ECF22B
MAAKESGKTDWWKRWPSLHEAEMAAFTAKGATVRTLNERHGFLILEVDWPMGERRAKLHIGYSPHHPFCRPSVSSKDLDFARHQNPFDGGLCLLIPNSGQWYPHQRVADLVDEQLTKIRQVNELRANENWDEAAQYEEQAPDPLPPYFAHLAEPISAIFFSSPTPVPNQRCGIAEFVVNPRAQNGSTAHFEAVLHQVRPISGAWLAPPFNPPNWLGDWRKVPGRWVRLNRPLPQTAEELIAAAEGEIAKQSVTNPAYQQLQQIGEAELALTAIIFDDEVAYGPNRFGDGWLFLASRPAGKNKRKRSVSLVRGFGISDDLFSRVPVAAALRDKKVLLVGCGAIGSFAAIELARAGIGKLTIVDHDIVEPGNSVRWPLGRTVWGVPKVAALRDFLRQNYPSTEVDALTGRLGIATTAVENVQSIQGNPRDELRKLIEGADIVIDTTASVECQAAIAHECRELGKSLVIGYATEGVAGGIVARFRPESSGCWICLNEHWEDKSIALPPQNPTATVLPIGCNSPTFTGGAFDLQEISLEVVRSAVGLMAPDAFDPGDWDWSSLALVDGERRRLPAWEAGRLEPHSRCAGCNAG